MDWIAVAAASSYSRKHMRARDSFAKQDCTFCRADAANRDVSGSALVLTSMRALR